MKEPQNEYSVAFAKTASERAALSPHELIFINVDVESVFITVLTKVPTLMSLRDKIAKLPDFEMANLDKVQQYAEALGESHMTYLGAAKPAEPLQEDLARAMVLREIFGAGATALVKRGLLDEKRLAEVKGGPGYQNAMTDMGFYSRIYRENWELFSSRTGIQLAEIEEADDLRKRIASSLGDRNQQSPAVVAASDDRQRAYTLLNRAWEQVRRAVSYLRFNEKDADSFAPSLFAGRGGRTSGSDTAPAVNAPGGNTPAPGNVAPKPGVADGTALPHDAPAPHVAGLPGGNPFTNS